MRFKPFKKGRFLRGPSAAVDGEEMSLTDVLVKVEFVLYLFLPA
jgi:hypothetical protein